jgi:hypothetical protein
MSKPEIDRCQHVDAATWKRCRRKAYDWSDYWCQRRSPAGLSEGYVRMYLCHQHGGSARKP